MTPKEKADQLVNVYYNSIMSFLTNNMKLENAKKCALIAVDEIAKETDWREYDYWQEVKQEIENL